MNTLSPTQPRLVSALLAGAVAIALNTAALAAADLVPLATAHGGLLRLLSNITGIAPPRSAMFQPAFHILVGLAMAVFYAFAVEPIIPGAAWLRGIYYGVAAWLANAVIVLPLIGEGFAGERFLTSFGIAWFAASHMLFFILMAIFYSRLRCRLGSTKQKSISLE
jgi:hypothetical protein